MELAILSDILKIQLKYTTDKAVVRKYQTHLNLLSTTNKHH